MDKHKIATSAVTCPRCSGLSATGRMSRPRRDRYGRVTREYYGWCLECELGYEVVEFFRGNEWFIHRYRYYYHGNNNQVPIPGDWRVVRDIPEPPLVMTGPGGDYDKVCDVEQLLRYLNPILLAMHGSMVALSKLLKKVETGK